MVDFRGVLESGSLPSEQLKKGASLAVCTLFVYALVIFRQRW